MQTFITNYHMLSLIEIFFIHHLLNEKYGIISLKILIAFKGQLKILIGKKHFSMLVLTKKPKRFNETIIRSFIPHKIVTCDDRDLSCMTRLTKKPIKDKNLFYQRVVKSKDFTNNDRNLEIFRSLQNNLTNIIKTTKQQYFAKIAKKVSDPNINSNFLTGEKVSCIPPIFHENRFIINFREKVESFNSFFDNQCLLIRNSSVLSTDYKLFTDKSLSNITFTDNDIGRIIGSLDPNKAHGYDMMNICMLKVCGDSIYKPLGIIFRACLEHGVFPQNGKKTNIVPIHKITESNQ